MNESKATRYHRLSRRARTAGAVSALLVLGLVALTPIGAALAMTARGVFDDPPGLSAWFVRLFLFVAPIVAAIQAATVPATFYLTRLAGDRGGQRKTPLATVLASEAEAMLVTLVSVFAGAVLVHGAAHVGGGGWWLIAGCGLAATVAVALRGTPLAFAALAAVKPLSRSSLADRLRDLATRIGTPVARIDEWEVPAASSVTAVVAGVGRGRRVLVSSAVAREWSDEEVGVIVAHELAHHAHHDLWRAAGLDVAVMSSALFTADLGVRVAGPALGIAGPADLAALPFIALIAAGCWLAATPLRHAHSRRQERRADAFALAATGHADAFAAVIRRLSARHLTEEKPSDLARWFFHRHPPVAERLALAQAYGRRPRPEEDAAVG